MCFQLLTGGKMPAGAGSNFLAGGTFFGRGFLVKVWSPVRLAEVMKLLEN